MPIYDNDGTAQREIGKLYDNNGSVSTQIGKVYDNNGSASTLIYTAELGYVGVTAPTMVAKGESKTYAPTSASTILRIEGHNWEATPTATGMTSILRSSQDMWTAYRNGAGSFTVTASGNQAVVWALYFDNAINCTLLAVAEANPYTFNVTSAHVSAYDCVLFLPLSYRTTETINVTYPSGAQLIYNSGPAKAVLLRQTGAATVSGNQRCAVIGVKLA